MQNIKTEVKGTILTITVDLAKTFGDSASGKTTIIASTQGNQPIAYGTNKQAVIGLNVYAKKEKAGE